MSLIVKKSTAIGVEIEDTEGTYKAPQSATSYVQTLQDGYEMSPNKELIERNIFTASIGRTSPRTGQFQVSGAVPVEARSHSTAGAAPEYDKLMRSAMGDRRQITTTTTTKASGNTAAVLQIHDADISKFTVNDIVMTKAAGAYHVSPISAISTGTGTATITLLIPHPSGDHPDSVVIEKSTTYILAEEDHPSLSVSQYLANEVLKQAVGCKITSMALENFATGRLPSFNFGFEGLNFDKSLTTNPNTPSYDGALPPIVLDAKVYQGTTEIEINELTVSLENTLGFKTATSAENGRISSRVTDRAITGTMNPYMEDDNIDNFDDFVAGTAFSLFAVAKIPTSTPGQFQNVVAIYLKNCVITEMGEQDQDGLMQESITFSADRGSAGTIPEMFIATI